MKLELSKKLTDLEITVEKEWGSYKIYRRDVLLGTAQESLISDRIWAICLPFRGCDHFWGDSVSEIVEKALPFLIRNNGGY